MLRRDMRWIDSTGYVVSPLDGVNGVRRNLLAGIGLLVGCRMSGAGRRSR
jgi:flagellar basal body P-ring protein FlgI